MQEILNRESDYHRPLLIVKGLKYFPVKWKVVEGGYNHPHILEQITKAIEKNK